MPVPHRPPHRRSLITTALAVTVLPFLLPMTASADDGPASGDTVVGELVQAWPEYEDPAEATAHAHEGALTWIETAAGEAVRVSTEDLADDLGSSADGVPVGATVEVVLGDEATDDPATDEGLEPALEVLSAEVVAAAPAEEPPLAAAASNQVTVVMMIPAGGVAEPGRTLAHVEAAVNGPVAAFWSEQSNDTIRLTTAAGNDPAWVQATVGCSDPYGLWSQAAAHATWTPGTGKHLLVYLPRSSSGCSYGLAQVGPSVTSGGRLYVTAVATSVIAHEFGHNFGLKHSSAQQCDRALERTPCRVVAYRDYYDIMGASWDEVGSLSPPQAAKLGLLAPGEQTVLSEGSGATVTLAPYGSRSGARVIKLVAADATVYWLEYRTATGADAWLGDSARNWPRLEAGVLLRREPTAADPTVRDDGSFLLDGTPAATAGWDVDGGVTLPVGQQVEVGAGFAVTVDDADPTGASVTVRPRSTIGSGQALLSRRALVSNQRGYRTVQQADGNLVLYAPDGRVLWATYRYASSARTVMQADGNLVTYAPDGRAVWWSGTWGNPGARLVIQDDGNLVIYRANGTAAWWTGMDTPNTLRGGQFLTAQQQLTSTNGRYRAVSQTDGNVVVYGPAGRVVWASYRYAYGGLLQMQPDGNLVSYGSGNRAVWWTATWSNPGARLVLQDDGNLVVYRANGTPAWWTGMDPLR